VTYTISITDPVHSELLKDASGKIVKIYTDDKRVSSFIHLEYWGVQQLSQYISTIIIEMENNASKN
jgi:hypothetical protein